MPDLTPFAGAIQTAIGAVIGGGVTLVGVWLTMRQQFRLEKQRDQQALRNATRDRLRGAFESAFLAAATMDNIAQRTLSLRGTKEELTVLYDEFRASRAELSRAGVRILLEQHATEVEAAYNEVRQIFENFQAQYGILRDDLTDDRLKQLEVVRQQQDALAQAVQNLREAMLAALAPLEKPIDDVARTHS